MQLRLDPKGEDVFNSTDISRSFKEPQSNENEVEGLRKRIKDLEESLKNKEVYVMLITDCYRKLGLKKEATSYWMCLLDR